MDIYPQRSRMAIMELYSFTDLTKSRKRETEHKISNTKNITQNNFS